MMIQSGGTSWDYRLLASREQDAEHPGSVRTSWLLGSVKIPARRVDENFECSHAQCARPSWAVDADSLKGRIRN